MENDFFEKVLELELIKKDPTDFAYRDWCSLEQIMDRLGHTDDQITKNVYLHVPQEMKLPTSLVNL